MLNSSLLFGGRGAAVLKSWRFWCREAVSTHDSLPEHTSGDQRTKTNDPGQRWSCNGSTTSQFTCAAPEFRAPPSIPVRWSDPPLILHPLFSSHNDPLMILSDGNRNSQTRHTSFHQLLTVIKAKFKGGSAAEVDRHCPLVATISNYIQ